MKQVCPHAGAGGKRKTFRGMFMEEELTKSGKPVSQKTFGTMVCQDKICRHAAVELELFDTDLRLFGRYLHHNGFRTIKEARKVLEKFVRSKSNPFVELSPKKTDIIDFNLWKQGRK
jgi:hypothetical protein